jgi:hypothetical protein
MAARDRLVLPRAAPVAQVPIQALLLMVVAAAPEAASYPLFFDTLTSGLNYHN